jgi:hypothetical protein
MPYFSYLKNWWHYILRSAVLILLFLSCFAANKAWQNYRPALIPFPPSAETLLDAFKARPSSPPLEAYAKLFQYFVEGFVIYKSPEGARAYYPGLPNSQGKDMASLEGFSRIAPLLAAWIYGGRAQTIELTSGQTVDLVKLISIGIVAGTDPGSKEYWGTIRHNQQSIVEAADIALVLWLTRESVWAKLTPDQKSSVATWLFQVNGKDVPDNNWHLFVVQVNSVLATLNMGYDIDSLNRHYARAKTFYAGGGWFKDGASKKHPAFDYYNAWAFHYHLQWLARIRPGLDDKFINDALAEFVSTYKYMIGPEGFPILGRSVCYRMAAPTPLIFGQTVASNVVRPGEARRALDSTWQYFIRHGAVKSGLILQGYCGSDARILDHYSGQASCFWSLRSLIAAFALPDKDSFWKAAPEALPVEKGSYRVDIKPTGWQIRGDSQNQSITILMPASSVMPPPAQLEETGLFDRSIEYISGNAHRPKNYQAKYGLPEYSSNKPFCGCKS